MSAAPPDRPRAAWIGLGTMGEPMAGHLLAAGFPLTVHNRTREREAALAERGAVRAGSPREAAAAADLVFTCVSDTPDLEAIVHGPDGALAGMRSGAVLVDCSTVAPAASRRLAAALAERGCGAVDAPVSGGSEGAQRGTLTVFAGGADADVARALPAIEAFAGTVTHLGGPGAGQAAKAVNQVLIAGSYATLGEGLALAAAEGLPLERLVEALSGGAAASWVLANRSGNVIRGEYPLGFRVALHLKDLKIALAEADRAGLELDVARLVAAQEQALVSAGFGDEDVSNVARVAKGELRG